jgi:hypothetical protein
MRSHVIDDVALVLANGTGIRLQGGGVNAPLELL